MTDSELFNNTGDEDYMGNKNYVVVEIGYPAKENSRKF